jgi:glucose-6-phosphate 1-dehydrogenase
MDELGVVSSWSVIEIPPHIADKVGATDLNLNIGGKYKLLENFQENLMFLPEVFNNVDGFNDIGQSMDLEFDPNDPNIFYFSTSESLFRCNRRISNVPT